jgi:uncharacterized protein YndB with AHSA1/START domain
MKFTNSVPIDRPREDVFDYLADLENLPHWNYAIQRTRKVTAGPVAVGTRYHQVRTVPTHQEETLEVVELDAGRRLVVRGTLSSFPALLEYDLETAGGGTVLTNTVDLTVPGRWGPVSRLASRQIKSAVAQNLSVLKQILEGADQRGRTID